MQCGWVHVGATHHIPHDEKRLTEIGSESVKIVVHVVIGCSVGEHVVERVEGESVVAVVQHGFGGGEAEEGDGQLRVCECTCDECVCE